MGMAMVLNLFFNPAFSLMPLLVKDYFGGGVQQLAWMETSFGVGMIAGSVLLGVWGGFARKLYTLLAGVGAMGLAIVILGSLPKTGIWYAIAAMAIIGIAQPLTQAPLMAIIQGTVSLELQGRVMGFLGTAAGIISPIGLLLAGPVSDWLGVQIWYIVAGVVALIAVPVGLALPALRDLDDVKTAPGEAV
jgi:DHA3 family macrolide efflux protein-like MFS transporter